MERASNLFALRYGKALVEATRRPGGVPVFGTNGQCGTHDTPLFKGPGVVLGRKGQGPLGVEWVDRDFWVIDTAYALAPLREDLDLKFSYYLIKYVGLNHLKDGTSNPSLSRDTFGAQLFPLPPPHAQRAIAHILGTIDERTELNRRMNETLEAMSRALFKSWFVDFDPVRATAEGSAPSGMDAETAKLFPREFVDSELGPIPKGWSVRSIGDLATIIGGSTPSTKDPTFWDNGEHFWATPKDLSPLETPVIRATERKITDSGLSQIGSGLLPPGTVLLSSRAPIGYLGIAEVPLAINQGFIAMKPNAGIPSLFLLRWAEAAHDEIVSRANGSTFLEISKSNFRPIPLVAAPTSVFRAFEAATSPLYRKVVLNENETTCLSSLRDGLLPRLLSGEVSVGDAEDVGKEKT